MNETQYLSLIHAAAYDAENARWRLARLADTRPCRCPAVVTVAGRRYPAPLRSDRIGRVRGYCARHGAKAGAE